MSSPYFNQEILKIYAPKMVDLIQQCNRTEGKVLPDIKPGFLRNQLPTHPPEEGKSLDFLLETTKNIIYPGVTKWQSPKFFAYFPSTVNHTTVLAEMFATAVHTPGFNFAVSPSHTELENLIVDWCAEMLGLPEKFFLKGSGGGIINNSASQSMFVSVHAAKHKKLAEKKIAGNNPDILKLVGYYGEGSHVSSFRGLLVKDIYHKRAVPYTYSSKTKNFEIDLESFKTMIKSDIEDGLIPFWFGASYGTTFSAAIDLSQQLLNICKQHDIWVNVDGAFLGSTWISEKYRPDVALLKQVNSIVINFSKLLLSGTGGSLFFVADKKQLTHSFGANNQNFSFYKNQFTQNHDVVDYKDWQIGLLRRFNSIKLYYTIQHYGVKKLREFIQEIGKQGLYLRQKVAQQDDLFQITLFRYSVIGFQVKDSMGKPSAALTRQVGNQIKNIQEGFCTPAEFKDHPVIRLTVGNPNTTNGHINNYVDAIAKKARQAIKAKPKL